MAMGTTQTINITTDMIDTALTALNTYRDEAVTQFKAVNGTMNTLLTAGNFAGAAADGYRSFYETNILPLIKEEESGQLMSLLKGFENFLTTVKQSLPESGGGVDDQLGKQNTSAGEE